MPAGAGAEPGLGPGEGEGCAPPPVSGVTQTWVGALPVYTLSPRAGWGLGKTGRRFLAARLRVSQDAIPRL